MADGDDLATRVALLEKSAVSRDYMGEREDKMLERFEKILDKFERRIEETMDHGFKVYGHSVADQLRDHTNSIHKIRDEKLNAAIEAVRPVETPKAPSQTNDFIKRWGLPLGTAALVGGPGTVVQVLKLISMVQ